MLQFWKKNGKKGKTDTKSRSTTAPSPHFPDPALSTLSNGETNYLAGPNSVGPLSGFNCEEFPDFKDEKWVSCKRSQLSKTLREILTHKGALGYFIKYLEARNVQSLVKFWLEAESFYKSATTKPEGLQTRAVPISREELERLNEGPRSSPQHSHRSLGTDCDSLYESPSHSTNSEEQFADSGNPTSRESIPSFSSVQKSSNNSARSNDSFVDNAVRIPNTVIDVNDLGTCDKSDSFRTDVPPGVPLGTKVIQSARFENATSVRESESTLPSLHNVNDISATNHLSLSVISSASPQSVRKYQQISTLADDAVRIYRKYLATACVHKIPVKDDVRDRVAERICCEDGKIDAFIFTEIQEIVFNIMNNEYYNSFLISEFHCKHQIDVLTSGRVSMADILYNETALFYFTEFMEQEGNASLVQFWLAAVNFQQHLLSKEGSYDSTLAQNDAMILYDKYFSMQATCPLGFSDKVRLDVEQNICREEGPLPDCFQQPIDMVQYLLEKNYLTSFLSSQLNMKYLTELVNTIQASPALLTRHKKTASESSSEWSISAQNTLLATEDAGTHYNKALHKVTAGEMCIDSRQLNDPDALWRRHRHNGLNFGRINHMGRFETDVEPEPDRKEESRLAKAVKKLVNMEEDKAKEEMAWQIAEMIVKDITSLTLGHREPVSQS